MKLISLKKYKNAKKLQFTISSSSCSLTNFLQIWLKLTSLFYILPLSDIKIQLVIMCKPYWHLLSLWMNYLEQIHDNFDQFWDTLGPIWGDSDLFSKDNSDLKWLSKRLLWIVAKVTIFSAISQWEQDTIQWRWCTLCTRPHA